MISVCQSTGQRKYQNVLTSLSDCNDVVARGDGWNAVLLDRGGHLKARQLDVARHDGMEAGSLKGENGVDADRPFLTNLDLGNPKQSETTLDK